MTVQIQLRRGTAANWTSNGTVVLAAGEPGFETDTGKLKVGDGTTTWASLPYAGGLEALRLQDLSNVSSTAPSSGQVLKWNGSAWAPAADATGGGGGGATYTISAETATGGVNLRLTGSDATTDDVKFAEGSNITLTRTDASTITIASTGGGASNLDGLSDVIITTPTTNQVLKYNGTNWVNGTDATGGGGGALDDLTDVIITAPITNQVLKYNGTNWINDTDATGTGAGLATRSSVSVTTSSLADLASADATITGGAKAYALLKIQTDYAAWVRVYTDSASRTNDSGRAEGVDPTPGSGVIAEVITTGAETILISPGTIGFSNEGPPGTNISIRVTNKSGSTNAITVTLSILQLEA